jgi:hypothetical protein
MEITEGEERRPTRPLSGWKARKAHESLKETLSIGECQLQTDYCEEMDEILEKLTANERRRRVITVAQAVRPGLRFAEGRAP